MECAEFAKKLDNQKKRDRKKPIDNSMRGQALKRARDPKYHADPSDPWTWESQAASSLDKKS